MKRNRFFPTALLIISFLVFACGEKPGAAASTPQNAKEDSAAKGPRIELSHARLPQSGVTRMHGTGFTPNSDVQSHLKRPDGTEFNVLSMFTNDKGEFDHDIESFLLQIGTHEVWVIDTKTKVSSNVATFETTRDPMPLAK